MYQIWSFSSSCQTAALLVKPN